MNEAVTSCCKAFNKDYQIRMVFPLVETQSDRFTNVIIVVFFLTYYFVVIKFFVGHHMIFKSCIQETEKQQLSS